MLKEFTTSTPALPEMLGVFQAERNYAKWMFNQESSVGK